MMEYYPAPLSATPVKEVRREQEKSVPPFIPRHND